MFSIGSHEARCFFITKVVYLPPVKLGVVLLTQKQKSPCKTRLFGICWAHSTKMQLNKMKICETNQPYFFTIHYY
ncbi:MAG: hypothetical protein IJD79_10655, partial [Clostridia bacterium]|nr:hypothetical protein [Clostridia bacterium]